MPYKSQNNEAEVIAQYFRGVNKGTLLSLGENDGITFSNTWDLIHSGWRGVLIEPGQLAYDRLMHRYKYNHDIWTYKFAVGEFTGPGEFCEASDGLLATTNPALLEKWTTVTYKKVSIDFFTFKDALAKFLIKKFDFITIDCEGMDYEILQQMDLTDLECKCLCVEHGGDMDRLGKINRYAAAHGLTRELLFNGENIILAKQTP